MTRPPELECPECGGIMRPRARKFFYACSACGKVLIRKLEEQTAGNDPKDWPVDERNIAEEIGAPDFTQVVVGWRGWTVPTAHYRIGEIPDLRSLVHTDFQWPSRAVAEAQCSRRRRNPFGLITAPTANAFGIISNPAPASFHICPGDSCTCGLYAAKTKGQLIEMGYQRYDADWTGCWIVLGEVALWGKVVEGSKGWRAQYGYPRRLYLPFEAHYLKDALEDAYGVPVRLNNWLGQRPPNH